MIMKKGFLILGAYLLFLCWGIGMLKASQETRRLLYGGKPVMAALHAESPEQTVLTLGGGEWEIALPAAKNSTSRIGALPPCTIRLVLRRYEIAGQTGAAIGRTAAFISV